MGMSAAGMSFGISKKDFRECFDDEFESFKAGVLGHGMPVAHDAWADLGLDYRLYESFENPGCSAS